MSLLWQITLPGVNIYHFTMYKELTLDDTYDWNGQPYLTVDCAYCKKVGRISWEAYQNGKRNICANCVDRINDYKTDRKERFSRSARHRKVMEQPEFEKTYVRKIDGRRMIDKGCPECGVIRKYEFTSYLKRGNKLCRSCCKKLKNKK